MEISYHCGSQECGLKNSKVDMTATAMRDVIEWGNNSNGSIISGPMWKQPCYCYNHQQSNEDDVGTTRTSCMTDFTPSFCRGAWSEHENDDDDDSCSWSSMGSDEVNGVTPMKLHANDDDDGMDVFWHRMDMFVEEDYRPDSSAQTRARQLQEPLPFLQQVRQHSHSIQPLLPTQNETGLPFLSEIQQWQNHHYSAVCNPLDRQGTLPYLQDIQQLTPPPPIAHLQQHQGTLPYLHQLQQWHNHHNQQQQQNHHHGAAHNQHHQEELPFLQEMLQWHLYQAHANSGIKGDTNNSAAYPSTRARTFPESYAIEGQPLGEGAFGIVYSCVSKQQQHNNPLGETNNKAVKIIPANCYDRNEVEILQHLSNCPHVVTLQDIFFGFDRVYLVMEEMKGGDLFTLLQKKTFFAEHEARTIIHSLLQAVQFLHSRFVTHRDIKPENILLADKNDLTTIKLADFGLAKRRCNELYTICGSVWYAAPEVIGRPNEETPYDGRCDNWSIGVIGYLLMAGYMPFEATNDQDIIQEVCRGNFEFHDEYWGTVSLEAQDFVSSLLQVNPNQRLSLKDALDSAWMKPLVVVASAATSATNTTIYNTVSWTRNPAS